MGGGFNLNKGGSGDIDERPGKGGSDFKLFIGTATPFLVINLWHTNRRKRFISFDTNPLKRATINNSFFNELIINGVFPIYYLLKISIYWEFTKQSILTINSH